MATFPGAGSLGWTTIGKCRTMSGHNWKACLALLLVGIMSSARTAVGQDCIKDLTELNMRIQAEWAEVLLFSNATRSAPYRYVLCPNTVFTVDSPDHQIVPVLDQTYITCGDDGLLADDCTIEERILNETAIIPEVMLLRAFSNYNRFLTVFSGIKFDTSYGVSAAAWDIHPMRVVFLGCHWTGSRGLRVIDNQVQIPNFPRVGEEAMIVQVDDGLIEDEDFEPGDDQEFDAEGTPLNIAIFTRGGDLQINNVTFRDNHLNYFIFASLARCNIRNSLLSNNQVEEGMFGVSSILTVTTTRFENNKYIVGSLSVADAAIVSRFNEFIGNTGLSDVVVLSVARGTSTTYGEVTSSCFVDGRYLAGPVLTAGLGDHEYEDVFVSGVTGDCTAQPFLESETQLCFDNDGFYIEDQPCLGQCDQGTTFAAEICALDPKPSAAPSKSPKPTASPQPSFRPTRSPVPTENPTEEPTYLSMLFGGTGMPTKIPTDPPTDAPVGVGTTPAPVATGPSVVDTSAPTRAPQAPLNNGSPTGLQTARSADTVSGGGDEGFCESGAGPFVCIGLPVLVAAVVIAVAVVVVLGKGRGGGGGNNNRELEIPPRSDDMMGDAPVGPGSIRSELS